jgi:hypothetical protein
MLLRRALIRAGFGYHRLLTLSMAYVAMPRGAEWRIRHEFSRLAQTEPLNGLVWFNYSA